MRGIGRLAAFLCYGLSMVDAVVQKLRGKP
jgi:hypothetical protein